MKTMEEQMQQMQEQVNQMKGTMLTSQGDHNLETPGSQHGSNSRQNSRVELGEDNDGEEDGEEDYVQRRVANPKSSSTYQDESLLEGMLRCHISMMIYDILAMLSQGPLHGHLFSKMRP